jgi:t-SNARE complex subunit (syntaxin)
VNDSEKLDRMVRLLEELRDNQRTQLERQGEALALQKQQVEMVREQHEKAVQLQDRAGAIQETSARLITRIQKFVPMAMVIVIILIIYLTWLLFRFWR